MAGSHGDLGIRVVVMVFLTLIPCLRPDPHADHLTQLRRLEESQRVTTIHPLFDAVVKNQHFSIDIR